MSVINDVQTNRVCALLAHSYFCLNTASVLLWMLACVGEVCEYQWCSQHLTCSYRGTTDGFVNSE